MTRLFTLIQCCLAGRTPLWLHWGTMSLGNKQLHLKKLSHRVLCCTVLALFFCALTNLLRQTNTNLLSVAASLSHSISISICIPFPSISTRHFSFTPLLTHLIATLDNFHSPCPHARKFADILELVALLAQHLCPQDLFVCVRVSTQWNKVFIPYL